MTRSIADIGRRRFIWCCLAAALASACVSLPRRAASTVELATPACAMPESVSSCVALNRATRAELEQLPGIGPVLAGRIVEFRERYGPFRRPEHVIMVRGMSDRRFRELRARLTLE